MTDYDNYDFWKPDNPDFYKGMSDEERIVFMICKLVGMVLVVLITILLCAMCSSCTTTQYIPLIEHHTDTLIQTKVQHDSIYINDSTVITEKGDTVTVERWHMKYVLRELHDTTYVSKTDTVPVPYPVETIKEVAQQLAWWQKTLMWLGVAMIAVFLIWVWRTK